MIDISFTLTYFQIYILSISLVSFLLYTYDKLQAIRTSTNISRVSENKLLFFSLIGGTIGSVIAMLLFRHKIKKISFIIKLSLVVIVQAILVYIWIKKFVSPISFQI